MKRLAEIAAMAEAWHEGARMPFYTCVEVKAALGAGAPAYAPALRILGWHSRRVRFYAQGSAPLLKVVWVPPGGFVARKRGRPLRAAGTYSTRTQSPMP